MPGKQMLRTEVGERVDHPDFEFLSDISHRDAVNQIMEALVVGTDDVSDAVVNQHPKFFVLSGFSMTAIGNAVSVEKDVTNGVGGLQPGAAIMAFRDRGAAKYGVLLSGGDTTKTIDISSFPNGSYGIFIRFAFSDDSIQNRLFWNPITPTPVETPRAIATRKSENWEIAVETVLPGPEWMRIGSVDRATMIITDERNFMFEGRPANSYAVVDAEWGSAQDRLSDRALHGAHSIYKAVRGLQRQVQDIIGETAPNGWWRTIEKSLKVMIPRDASRTIQGILTPDGNNTRDLGTLAAAFASFFVNQIRLGEALLDTDADAQIARVRADFSDAAGRERTLIFRSQRSGGSSGWPLRIYHVQNGTEAGADTLEFAFNCEWNNATDLWTQLEAANRPFKFELGPSGLACYRKDPEAGAGGTFTDAIGAGGWTNRGVRFLFGGTSTALHHLIAPKLWARGGIIGIDDDQSDSPLERSEIQLQSLAASAAKKHAIRGNHTADTLEMRGGDSGQSAVWLNGTGVKIAKNCQGQNGVFYFDVTWSHPGGVSSGSSGGESIGTIVPPGGMTAFNNNNSIILGVQRLDGALLGQHTRLAILNWTIGGSGFDNEILVNYVNAAGVSSAAFSQSFRFVILRKTL